MMIEQSSPTGKAPRGNAIMRAKMAHFFAFINPGKWFQLVALSGDMVAWKWILRSSGMPDPASDIGSNRAVFTRGIAKRISWVGKGPEFEFLGMSVQSRRVDVYVPSAHELIKKFVIAPQLDLEQAIANSASLSHLGKNA